MTGLQVCERLRADPATADLPVILMTGSADDPGLADQVACAGDTCLAKPDPTELLAPAPAAPTEIRSTCHYLASTKMNSSMPSSDFGACVSCT